MIEYDENAIVLPYVTSYLREKTTHTDALLHELEDYARDHSVPIAEPETARFLSVLTSIVNPSEILEIGTAIGYSAILMAKSAPKAKITTLEYNSDMAGIARENIKRAGLSERIEVVNEDAKDYLAKMGGVFDIIFLDGPKAHYIYMLDECVRLLRPGGVLVSDNVLYKGMIPDDNHVVRRKITIVKRLRKYIDALMNDNRLRTAILSLGDGVTVSYKIDKAEE